MIFPWLTSSLLSACGEFISLATSNWSELKTGAFVNAISIRIGDLIESGAIKINESGILAETKKRLIKKLMNRKYQRDTAEYSFTKFNKKNWRSNNRPEVIAARFFFFSGSVTVALKDTLWLCMLLYNKPIGWNAVQLQIKWYIRNSTGL